MAQRAKASTNRRTEARSERTALGASQPVPSHDQHPRLRGKWADPLGARWRAPPDTGSWGPACLAASLVLGTTAPAMATNWAVSAGAGNQGGAQAGKISELVNSACTATANGTACGTTDIMPNAGGLGLRGHHEQRQRDELLRPVRHRVRGGDAQRLQLDHDGGPRQFSARRATRQAGLKPATPSSSTARPIGSDWAAPPSPALRPSPRPPGSRQHLRWGAGSSVSRPLWTLVRP